MRVMIFCKRCGNYAADGLDACPKCTANLMDTGHPSLVGGMVAAAAPAPAGRSAAALAAGAMFGSMTEPAGHGQRFVAFILDGFIQGLIVAVGAAAFIFVGGMAGLVILGVTLILAFIGYESYFIGTKGATIGKSAMGLRVTGKDGGAVGMGQSVGRCLLKLIFNELFIPLFIPLLNERRQALHDMVVGTVVVRG
jgi:uncharacterized RDD family membrane protein YckC